MKKINKQIIWTILIIIGIFFIARGMRTFSILDTNLQQNYPLPFIIIDNINSRVIGASWSNARPDLYFTGDVTGEMNMNMLVRTEDIPPSEQSQIMDKNILVLGTYKTKNVEINGVNCIIDYASGRQRGGSAIILSSEASCSTPIDSRSGIPHLGCNINSKIQCLENGVLTTSPYRLGGINNVKVQVEILKKDIQCTSTQLSLCQEKDVCLNNICSQVFQVFESSIQIVEPVSQETIQEIAKDIIIYSQNEEIGKIENDELIINNEKIGDVVGSNIINEEKKVIGKIEAGKLILESESVKDDTLMIIIASSILALFVIFLLIFLLRRRR